jgi:hypothetical protein
MFSWLRKKPVFTNININLTGPICRCERQNLSWGLTHTESGKHSLYVQCNDCKTELRVGPEHFKAGFRLDQPYPQGDKPKQDAKILKLAVLNQPEGE